MNDISGQLNGLRSSTIMMVDDEPTTVDVLEMFLKAEGYEKFLATTDSRQALDMLAEKRPDVLILNLIMPNIGGLEILRSMRNDEALEDIPVIILTSSTDPEMKLEAAELGATDFLGKPVDPSELSLRLRNALAVGSHRAERIAVSSDQDT